MTHARIPDFSQPVPIRRTMRGPQPDATRARAVAAPAAVPVDLTAASLAVTFLALLPTGGVLVLVACLVRLGVL